jgi:RHS repeat-associated protein
LTSVTDKTASGAVTRQVFYTYDVFDRRVAKQVDWDGAGAQVASKEYYFYDGQHIALKFVDPDASGAQPSALRSRLLHGPVVDQILAEEVLTSMTAPGNVLWPLTDNMGTVRDIVDFNEATNISQIANHLAYDAFGRITSETNAAVDSLFAFTGRERDEESWYWDAALNRYTGGHYFYRGRVYDPVTGRFLSQDPIGFAAGDANLYRYVENNPTNATDPSGFQQVTASGAPSYPAPKPHNGYTRYSGCMDITVYLSITIRRTKGSESASDCPHGVISVGRDQSDAKKIGHVYHELMSILSYRLLNYAESGFTAGGAYRDAEFPNGQIVPMPVTGIHNLGLIVEFAAIAEVAPEELTPDFVNTRYGTAVCRRRNDTNSPLIPYEASLKAMKKWMTEAFQGMHNGQTYHWEMKPWKTGSFDVEMVSVSVYLQAENNRIVGGKVYVVLED